MQGASLKPQATGFKLQATSIKLHNILPLIKFYKVKGEGLLLYAELEIPEVFAELVTPLISTTDPTDKLCGNSVS